MTITALPPAPQRSDPPATFISRADAFVAALSGLTTEMNATFDAINALSQTAPISIAGLIYDNGLTSGDPGAGGIRFNTTTFVAATSPASIYIDDTLTGGTISIKELVDTFDSSTSATKGIIRIYETGTPANYVWFRVTAVSNAATYSTITVVPILCSVATTATLPFLDNDSLTLQFWPNGDAGSVAGGVTMTDANITGIKLAMYNGEVNNAATSGTININWQNGARQKQVEPTSNITYTMTAPASPCHLQLRVISDGTSPAVMFAWPGTVKWLGAAYINHPANKGAIIAGWYDGTNYWLQGASEV